MSVRVPVWERARASVCVHMCACVFCPEKGERPAPPLGPPHPRTTMAPTYVDLSTLECSDVWLSHRTSTLRTSPRNTHTHTFYNANNWIPEHLVLEPMKTLSGDRSYPDSQGEGLEPPASLLSDIVFSLPIPGNQPSRPWLQPTRNFLCVNVLAHVCWCV